MNSLDLEENFDILFLPAILDVDMASVPGQCNLNTLGTTNKQVFGIDSDGNFNLNNLRLIRSEVYTRYKSLCSGEAIADPLKVFIKQEPHKRKKLEEGRLRLIMSVSLIDAIVDRILFMKLMYKVVRNYAKTHVMIGWSPSKGGYRYLNSIFKNVETLSIDKKAWDWSVPIWLLDSVEQVIMRIAADAPLWWKTAVHKRFELLFKRAQFSFSDGSLVCQEKPGVMKSGCYLTIFINSVAQMLLHDMASFRLDLVADPIVVLGDDTLQKYIERWTEYVKYLESLGFTLEVERHKDRFEFAGFTYSNDYMPAYQQKHLFMLSHLTTDRTIACQTLQNYQVLYAFDETMLQIIRNMLCLLEMPEGVLSRERLRELSRG